MIGIILGISIIGNLIKDTQMAYISNSPSEGVIETWVELLHPVANYTHSHTLQVKESVIVFIWKWYH